MQRDNLREAIKGAVVGATLGAPFRGQNQFRKLNFYEPIPTRMTASEALDAWVVWIQHLRRGLPPEALSASTYSAWMYTTHESAFGLANLARGFDAPMAGRFQNPLAAGSQALGRAAFWGLALSESPSDALKYAFFDATSDHDSVGAACAVAIAAMAATARPGVAPTSFVKVAKDVLPAGHPAHQVIARLVQCVGDGKDPATTYDLLPPTLPTQDSHYAPLNLAYVLFALLYGRGEFGATVKLAAGCGGASDQVGLAAGAIAGACASVDAEWLQPIGDAFVAGHGLRGIEPPSTITMFIDSICDLGRNGSAPEPEVTEPQPETPTSSGRPVVIPDLDALDPVVPEPVDDTPAAAPAPSEAPVVEPVTAAVAPDVKLPPAIQAMLDRIPDTGFVFMGGLTLKTQYVDPPVVVPGKTNRFVVTFANNSDEEQVVEPHLTVAAGWAAAHKLASFRLRPGEESQFPIVIQAPTGVLAPVTNVRIAFGQQELLVPLIAGQPWYWVGPFVNHDGSGFDKAYRAEDVQKSGETFNGRSDLPVKWTREWFEGVLFDLEPKFINGPGVLYLWAKVRLGEPGKYRIVVASPVGARVWIDKKELVRYHDVHIPIPRAIQPYVGEFETTGESEVLIKIMRNRDPMATPTTIYFLASDGRHVEPFGFTEMEA